MDPFTIVAITVSALSQAYMCVDKLKNFIERASVVDNTVQALYEEVKLFCGNLEAIQTLLQKPDIRQDGNLTIWLDVKIYLKQCEKTAMELGTTVDKVDAVRIPNKSRFIRSSGKQLMFDFKAEDIKQFQQKIYDHSTSLQLALQTINLHIATTMPEKVDEVMEPRFNALQASLDRIESKISTASTGNESLPSPDRRLRESAQAVASSASIIIRSRSSAHGKTKQSTVLPRSETAQSESQPDLVTTGSGNRKLANPVSQESSTQRITSGVQQTRDQRLDPTRLCSDTSITTPKSFSTDGATLAPGYKRLEREGSFGGPGRLLVVDYGFVDNDRGYRVGTLVEGDPDDLVGYAVDEDGVIWDRDGNVLGRAKPWGVDEDSRKGAAYPCLRGRCGGANVKTTPESKKHSLPYAVQMQNDSYQDEALEDTVSKLEALEKPSAHALESRPNTAYPSGSQQPVPAKKLTEIEADEAVRILKNHDFRPDEKRFPDTQALFWAADAGNDLVVRLLLQGWKQQLRRTFKLGSRDSIDRPGVYVDVETVEGILGITPLHFAALHGHDSTCQILFDHGASVQSRYRRQDDEDRKSDRAYGYTPLEIAIKQGHANVVKLFIANGANLSTPIGIKFEFSVVHIASHFAQMDILLMLLAATADLMATTRRGESALHTACFCGHNTVIKKLLALGITVDVRDTYSRTPLLWAVRQGRQITVKLLLENDADINACDNNGCTALHIAAAQGHHDLIPLLLDGGCNMQAFSGDGYTALHYAASHGRSQCVKIVIDAGADTKTCNDFGLTALHCAAFSGISSRVRAILNSAGTDINAYTKRGETALLIASRMGNRPVADALINKGANILLKDNNNYNAIHHALQKGFLNIVATMKQAGVDYCRCAACTDILEAVDIRTCSSNDVSPPTRRLRCYDLPPRPPPGILRWGLCETPESPW